LALFATQGAAPDFGAAFCFWTIAAILNQRVKSAQ